LHRVSNWTQGERNVELVVLSGISGSDRDCRGRGLRANNGTPPGKDKAGLASRSWSIAKPLVMVRGVTKIQTE